MLEERFTSAPVLTIPDPKLQFILEVDASEVGIGAVLSQRSTKDNQLHPCTFLSRKLTLTEWNYDGGNWELLAIKVALGEWRRWLEGAEPPFLVWTNHRNLEYLQSARHLNSRQARWALFFNRFNFHLSYRPGAKNIKPDASSRVYCTDPKPAEPEYILPRTCILGAVQWEVEDVVHYLWYIVCSLRVWRQISVHAFFATWLIWKYKFYSQRTFVTKTIAQYVNYIVWRTQCFPKP